MFWQHPIKAGIDMAALSALLGWWFDFYPHFMGGVATTVTAAWYGYNIYCKWKDRQ